MTISFAMDRELQRPDGQATRTLRGPETPQHGAGPQGRRRDQCQQRQRHQAHVGTGVPVPVLGTWWTGVPPPGSGAWVMVTAPVIWGWIAQ